MFKHISFIGLLQSNTPKLRISQYPISHFTAETMAPPPTQLGNLLRLTPLQHDNLPAHSSLPNTTQRPDLLPFILTMLAQGSAFLSKDTFPAHFAVHSTKTSKDASENVPVEVHKLDVPASALQSIDWEGGSPIKRRKPTENLSTEYWFTRHSRHANILSTEPEALKVGGASWKEFVFGLRDHHSKHEEDFTPTLYDAKTLIDWDEEVKALEAEGKLVDSTTGQRYTRVSFYAAEMCHAIPAPLQPRCFPVLVCTASLSETSFIVVTIPVDLGPELGYYSAGKNSSSETDSQKKKRTVVGLYTAVETVYLEKGAEGKEMIDWTMATASDTRGNLPMFALKMGLPGAVVKDVGLFLRWIRKVPNSEKENVIIG